MKKLASLWFGVQGRVTRKQYFVSGVVLLLLKYAIDAGAVFAVTGELWMPWHYVNPLLTMRQAALGGDQPQWLVWAMGAWAIPFAWIGVSMTLRRALDARVSPWCALLFFVPIVNWITMISLSLAPSRPGAGELASVPGGHADRVVRGALLGVGASVAIGAAMTALCALVLSDYGWSLFVGTPFVQGVATGYFYNRGGDHGLKATFGVVTLGLLILGGALLLFALEGALCLAMAAPLALGIALLGGIFGRTVARTIDQPRPLAASMSLLPLLALAEVAANQPGQYHVTTDVVIAAPPATVWNHVVEFSELPQPNRWLFATGVAYPTHARIDGRGVGAVRHCEFSTGAFVEPITVWDEPRRLAFDVVAQPVPMHEWSPYKDIHPPHLDGYFRSVRGQFLLTPTADGGTHLAGTTWYELDIFPRPYWSLLSDAIVHAIHRRVLDHIAAEAEREHAGR
ncbi:SRPBCC family protein [Haliangium sp.]|uniref:SRPBCC family protein n=1 Tax=Haliangium sp. TaxID=2663208 RepID=UPI003D1464D1